MKTWTTKEGKKIDLKDMSVSHIKNTIAILKRNNGKTYITGFSDIWGVDAWEETTDYNDKIDAFKKELKRRNKE